MSASKPVYGTRRRTVITAAVERDANGRLVDDDGWVIGYSAGEEGEVDEETAKRATTFQQNVGSYKAKAAYEKADPDSAAAIAGVKDTYYEFMGLAPDCDYSEIRNKFRQLSKMYHPDTTKLDPVQANTLFMRLQDIYDVLSEPEKRQFYDWRLTLEVVQGYKGNEGISGYVVTDTRNQAQQRPDVYVAPIDRMSPGENMDLSDQAQFALAFDLMAFGLVFFVIALAMLMPPADIPELVPIP